MSMAMFQKTLFFSTLLFVTVAATAQVSAVSSAPQTVLARGPFGVIVTSSDVLSDLRRAPEATRQAMLTKPENIQQLASNLMVRRVLAKEAERDGLAKDALVAAALAIASDKVLSDARLGKLDLQNAPSEATLDAYAKNVYQANTSKFERPAQTRARHILLSNKGPDSLQKATEILSKLRAGASFEETAKQHSTDAGSAVRGGDLGFFSAGQMVRPFEDAVNKLVKPGDLSEPVESQFGYHIIRLEERREKGLASYTEVRAQLIEEARVALLNEARVQKVESMNKEIMFEAAAIDAMSKGTGH